MTKPNEYDLHALFWLAARDYVFFGTYNHEKNDWDEGYYPVVLCSDTFSYACADAESLAPGQEHELKALCQEFGWSGAIAWAAHKRKETPLKQLQTEQYHAAIRRLEKIENKE